MEPTKSIHRRFIRYQICWSVIHLKFQSVFLCSDLFSPEVSFFRCATTRFNVPSHVLFLIYFWIQKIFQSITIKLKTFSFSSVHMFTVDRKIGIWEALPYGNARGYRGNLVSYIFKMKKLTDDDSWCVDHYDMIKLSPW